MRVCVIGAAGGVGSVLSAELVGSRLVDEVLLVDIDADRARVREMDLRLRTALTGGAEVRRAEPHEAGSADILVLTAGMPHRDGTSRSSMLRANAGILHGVLDPLPREWAGTAVIATNPVDPLCTLASRKLDHATVLGYTLQDSLRLAEGIAEVLSEPPGDIHAWAIGEHGPDMVPLFDRTRVRGRAVRLTRRQRQHAVDYALSWYDVWQRCRTGLTSVLSSGAGIAHLITALLGRPSRVLPACAALTGQYGLADLCIGVPVRMGAGTAEVVEWPLAENTLAALHRSARVVDRTLGRRWAKP